MDFDDNVEDIVGGRVEHLVVCEAGCYIGQS